MAFLSELGKRKSQDIGFNDYAQCAQQIGLKDDTRLLLEEILESGILKGDLAYLDFIHPTMQGFFHARFISSLSLYEIIAFIKEKHSQEAYFETILFLIGLLRDQGKQDQFLDYLEENDLELYLKCINARYHIDLSASVNYQDVECKYLAQL